MDLGISEMGGGRQRLQVADRKGIIARERTLEKSRHETDVLYCATEVGAVKDRRDPPYC
jgi:hypothetical protein